MMVVSETNLGPRRIKLDEKVVLLAHQQADQQMRHERHEGSHFEPCHEQNETLSQCASFSNGKQAVFHEFDWKHVELQERCWCEVEAEGKNSRCENWWNSKDEEEEEKETQEALFSFLPSRHGRPFLKCTSEYKNVPPNQRVQLASFHMEGLALQWHRWLSKFRGPLSWDELTKVALLRFGPTDFDDPADPSSCLWKTTTTVAYLKVFERTSNQEARDRREKGLCYYCDDKYAPSHCCEHPQLFMIANILASCDNTEDEDQ
ncbi:hypothetical protein FNV43_RR11216 [Rhamnella rubrinervis]|uniref:Retrotransposon gag domain-containing protein n=1 Tax=Rhamnella rubrinervis TaxID=2594499 RepID=A0A8K0H5Y1_9ROSA|nr:hypothetical protein FNV43_RR11216 [Rhamnella rubrinervis]